MIHVITVINFIAWIFIFPRTDFWRPRTLRLFYLPMFYDILSLSFWYRASSLRFSSNFSPTLCEFSQIYVLFVGRGILPQHVICACYIKQSQKHSATQIKTRDFTFVVQCVVFYKYILHIKCPTVLPRPWRCDCLPNLDIFKRTLPQRSLPNVTYVVPVAVNYSYCTPDDGYGKCPKHVERSCNKIKIVLHFVRHFMCTSIFIKTRGSKNNSWSLLLYCTNHYSKKSASLIL
jgi:hypothetical protein